MWFFFPLHLNHFKRPIGSLGRNGEKPNSFFLLEKSIFAYTVTSVAYFSGSTGHVAIRILKQATSDIIIISLHVQFDLP